MTQVWYIAVTVYVKAAKCLHVKYLLFFLEKMNVFPVLCPGQDVEFVYIGS